MRTIETTYGRTDIEPTKVDIGIKPRGNLTYVWAYFHAKGTYFRTINMPIGASKAVAAATCKVVAKSSFPFNNGDGDSQWTAYDPDAFSIAEVIAANESK